MVKMETVDLIKLAVRSGQMSMRGAARHFGVSRQTVKRYLDGAEAGVRQQAARPQPVRSAVASLVAEILEDSRNWTRGKQRLTTRKLHELVLARGGEGSLSLIKEIAREWRRQRAEVFVPLVYTPGDEAQVDFFEIYVRLAGVEQKCFAFVMRMMYSGADFVRVYARQDQISFLDAHVRAFAFFGGIPAKILYDNLKAAVTKILMGSERKLSERFRSLCSHYGFGPVFARPARGSDKGGVEARGKGIRLQEFVPIPEAESLEELNARYQDRFREQLEKNDEFATERSALIGLPLGEFDPARFQLAQVSRRALVRLQGADYSVPEQWIGLSVSGRIMPDRVEITGPDQTCVYHARIRTGKSVDYRHYIHSLSRKPRALLQVASECIPQLGEPFVSVWTDLCKRHDPESAARQFCEVLRGIERDGVEVIARRLTAALRENRPPLLALAPTAESKKFQPPRGLENIEVEASDMSAFASLTEARS
jgi:transposase